jgi:type II secretory pathway pseudopilin PulG
VSGAMRKSGGFLLADLIVGITLFGVLLAGLAVSLHGFGSFNRYQWTRQLCIAAASAQLDSMTATGEPIVPDECERLWPRVTVSMETTPGEGQWAGLKRVDVKASAQAGPRQVVVELERYIGPPAEATPEEGSL